MIVLRRLASTTNNAFLRRTRGFSNESMKESPLKGLLDDSASFNDKNNSDWATTPYPVVLRDDIDTETIDARETSIILFPGQGTQYLGMEKDLMKYPNAKEIYECASEVAGTDLTKISTKEELDKYCQISVVANSLAAVERLRDMRPTALPSCVATAGLSLGEVTALIFAGCFTLEEGLKFVNIRALAMEAASKTNPGLMMTTFLSPETNIRAVCKEALDYCIHKNLKDQVCKIANFLYPSCVVLAGTEEALHFVHMNAKNYGIKKISPLKVSGAFHTELMAPAMEPVSAALEVCNLEKPKVPVYSAIDGRPYKEIKHIKYWLPKQIVAPVKWEQLMQSLFKRKKGSVFPRTFEVGPGNSVRSILRKINANAWDNSYHY